MVDHAWWNEQANKLRTQLTWQVGHSYLCVAELNERKGIMDVTIAFHMRFKPDDTLRKVGKGPLRSKLQTLMNTLHIYESVNLVGAKCGSNLANEYSRAQTLVLESHKEGWDL